MAITYSQAIKNNRDKALRAMEKAVIMIEADAKLNCPVLTGTLKRSITHDIENTDEKIVGVVGSNVEYAYWAEQKQPFLEPAFDSNIEHVKRIFQEELSR